MSLGQNEAVLENILAKIIKSAILPHDCYLAGGTALYFHLHHRLSVDLDFFSPKPFSPETFMFKFRQEFGEVDLELMEKETLILFLSPEKLKFSLFYLPYRLLSPLVPYEIKPGIFCSLASLNDIEAMKTLALVQRGSAKDFVDLFYLLKKTGHSFTDLSLLVQRKYDLDDKYNYHLKTGMVYFDDAEQELGAIMIVDESGDIRSITEKEWKGIKGFFVRLCL
jgi:predicted nucleotidyltransferase component of viral defense system